MPNHIYLIHSITNMHVGSGNTIGIVDKTIQRDPVTDRPIIHGSSLKGALREYCELKNLPFVKIVFGGESNSSSSSQGTAAGSFRFLSAHLISMPMRSNKLPYFNVTCPGAIKELLELAKCLGFTLTQIAELNEFAKLDPGEDAIVFDPAAEGGNIEDFGIRYHQNFDNLGKVKEIIGDFPALIRDTDFSNICKNEMPVIARNKLDNGKSTNLWYEEIVPRESRFVFGLLGDGIYDNEFEKVLLSDLVQIGGNATVGYGFTKIRRLI